MIKGTKIFNLYIITPKDFESNTVISIAESSDRALSIALSKNVELQELYDQGVDIRVVDMIYHAKSLGYDLSITKSPAPVVYH